MGLGRLSWKETRGRMAEGLAQDSGELKAARTRGAKVAVARQHGGWRETRGGLLGAGGLTWKGGGRPEKTRKNGKVGT